jgi:hypothetical protein
MDTSSPDAQRNENPRTEQTPDHLPCAYSPRWLSGPTPAYRGLCPTWSGDEPTGEQRALTSV